MLHESVLQGGSEGLKSIKGFHVFRSISYLHLSFTGLFSNLTGIPLLHSWVAWHRNRPSPLSSSGFLLPIQGRQNPTKIVFFVTTWNFFNTHMTKLLRERRKKSVQNCLDLGIIQQSHTQVHQRKQEDAEPESHWQQVHF